jgi:hypothetical protein
VPLDLLIIGLGLLVEGSWIWIWSRLHLGTLAADECTGTGYPGWWKQACWISTLGFWLVLAGGTLILTWVNVLSAFLSVPIGLVIGVLAGWPLARLPPSQAYWAAVASSLKATSGRLNPKQRVTFNLLQDRLLGGEKEEREAILDRILRGDAAP